MRKPAAKSTLPADPVAAPKAASGPPRKVYGIGQLLTGLNGLLEDRVGRIWVAGEISNFHRAGSGHCYFALKDAEGQLRAALFRSSASRLRFEPSEGLEVLAYADVNIYAARGELQLVVRQLEPRGKGALQLAFEQLQQKLQAEGLFAPERKQPVPEHPRRVGVVTSPTSAAVRDVIEVAGQRSPGTPILIAATRVQGEGAEFEIAEALRVLALQPEIDVILLVRGGGSIEDLWAFNTEAVARAIAACPIPVISGVGHETDFTIADAVADLRMPTPSAASAAALPDRLALRQQLNAARTRLETAMRARVRGLRARLEHEKNALRVLAPSARLAAQRRALIALRKALGRAMQAQIQAARARLGRAGARLDSLSPLAVLSRGYALVFRTDTGGLVRAASEVVPGDSLRVRLREGELSVRAEKPNGAKD